MCGILVYISHKEIPQSKEAVKIKNLMKCRGQMINHIRLNLTKKIYIFFTQDYLLNLHRRSNQPYNFKKLFG